MLNHRSESAGFSFRIFIQILASSVKVVSASVSETEPETPESTSSDQ